MLSIRAVAFGILTINVLAITIATFSAFNAKSNASKLVNLPAVFDDNDFLTNKLRGSMTAQEERELATKSSYRFDDPKIAYYILEKLDIFEIVDPIKGANYKTPAGGFKINDNYCDEHRAYFVEHPEMVFEQRNIITNYWRRHKLRTQIIPMFEARDMHKEVYPGSPDTDLYKYDMTVNATMFYTYNLFYYKRQVGKQFSCLSQVSNHIPGHDKMYRKDYVGQSLVEYASKYKSRPTCFNYNRYFPKTWVLQKKDQCLDFFKEFNSQEYQKMKKERNVVYFRKIGANVHEGKGVFPVDNEEEVYIRKLYKNGALCGKVKDNNLIQYNVHNLLLLDNRKFGFRMFLLIASTNPVLAYYHDGYARLSMNEYDPTSKEKKTFVTNIGVNLKEASQGTIYQNMTPEQIQEHTCWFLEDFHRYLMEHNIIRDPNWLDNHLRPEFKKVMVHLIRMAQSGFFKKSSLFELFGLDFVMDENLELWFIEANSMPLIDGFTKDSTKLINKMMADTFEIVLGLLKSRMKRVITYINEVTKEVNETGLSIRNLDQKRNHFKKIAENYFEPEFVPSPDNTFYKIIDDREYGIKRYAGLIEKKCL